MTAVQRRTSRDIRTANRYAVLRQVIAGSPASRQKLAAATGLSLATVANLVGELIERRMVLEVGFEESDGGRPRGLVAANPRGGVLIGVDLGETFIHAEAYDLRLEVLATAGGEFGADESRPDAVADRITAAVTEVAAKAAVHGEVLGVGVSVPGQVDRERGIAVFAPNWDWRDVPLHDLLAARLPGPLHLDNPMRAAMAAELWFGAARDCADAVAVILGTGVGAGLAVGGALHRGRSNSAGEWGHTTLVLDGRPCRCGNRGCVEAYTGAPGIMRTLAELRPGSPLLREGDQQATVRGLGRAAAGGDSDALAVVEETARCLGAGVADLVNLLNPEVVVLSSWVAEALGETLVRAVRGAVAARALARPWGATRIALSRLGSSAVSLGAASFALEGALAPLRGRLAG
ncbi:transcriptional regulator [Mangrovactinospora gilvigrisea]|uniref:Transcriptional regulator n=1 Tax=Mangrovactinospora gilvigrisea TaxID=1428644 RepID=A0A1J7C1S4_9ACTN|nr:ROK family transcriptional regulator [Mangrovactinospora gilvigrisea]OIV35520.1 transcriptional regulator [Mangrovactinospora gilvigrisea]